MNCPRLSRNRYWDRCVRAGSLLMRALGSSFRGNGRRWAAVHSEQFLSSPLRTSAARKALPKQPDFPKEGWDLVPCVDQTELRLTGEEGVDKRVSTLQRKQFLKKFWALREQRSEQAQLQICQFRKGGHSETRESAPCATELHPRAQLESQEQLFLYSGPLFLGKNIKEWFTEQSTPFLAGDLQEVHRLTSPPH